MALDLGELVAYLNLDSSNYTKGFDDAEQKAQGFGNKVPGWMMGAAAGVTAAAAVAIGGLIAIGSTWDDVADTIRVNTGATGDELDGMIDSAKNVASKVPVEIEKIAPVLSDVSQRFGLTGDDLEEVTGQILNASRMLGEDIDVDTLSASMNAFGIESGDVSKELDYLWQVTQGTGIGMNDLVSQLQTAAPITQQLGFSFDETAAMIGSMDKAGLDSQGMIGAMTKGLASITKPGEDASEVFKTNVDAIQGFIDKGDDAAARDLAKKIFGTKGAAKFVGALKTGALNLEDLAAGAGLTGDSINSASDDTADFAEKWQLVKNKASIALEPLGSQVFGALGGALDKVMPYLESFTGWLQDNPVALQAMAAVLGILALAFVGVTVATWAMNTALLANPITWIILGIVALIAALVLLIANWDSFVAWLSDVWGAAVEWLKGIWDSIATFFTDLWDGITTFFTDLWNGIIEWFKGLWQGIVDWFIALLTGYVAFWEGVWNGVVSFFRTIITAYVTFWRGVWDGIIGFFRGAWEGVISWIRGYFESAISGWKTIFGNVATWFSTLWDNVKTGWRNVWDGITDFFSGIPDTIKGFFSGIGSWLYDKGRDLVNGLINGVKSLAGRVGEFFLDKLPGWIVGPFKAALGIHSPSRVFGGFADNTVDGYLNRIAKRKGEITASLSDLVDTQEFEAATTFTGSTGNGTSTDDHSQRSFTYVAAENQSLTAEEALFEALSGPRGGGTL